MKSSILAVLFLMLAFNAGIAEVKDVVEMNEGSWILLVDANSLKNSYQMQMGLGMKCDSVVVERLDSAYWLVGYGHDSKGMGWWCGIRLEPSSNNHYRFAGPSADYCIGVRCASCQFKEPRGCVCLKSAGADHGGKSVSYGNHTLSAPLEECWAWLGLEPR